MSNPGNLTGAQVLKPSPPSLIRSITAGFDATSNHLGLILFPILLDIYIWLGPRLNLQDLISRFFADSAKIPELQSPENATLMKAMQEAWLVITARFNLFTVLRTYPIGIPSLMSGVSPLNSPLGSPVVLQVDSWGELAFLLLGIALLGLMVGTMFFLLVCQASLKGELSWGNAFHSLPWAYNQVLQLTLILLGIILAVSIPMTCLLTVVMLSGFSVGPILMLIYGGLMAWILIPLVFSPLGIFVYHRRVWNSLTDGMRVTRLTLPSTLLFLLLILILSRGLDMLWSIPKEGSWMAIVGVLGHAFVSTALLAAIFIYYRDANTWMLQMVERLRSASSQTTWITD